MVLLSMIAPSPMTLESKCQTRPSAPPRFPCIKTTKKKEKQRENPNLMSSLARTSLRLPLLARPTVKLASRRSWHFVSRPWPRSPRSWHPEALPPFGCVLHSHSPVVSVLVRGVVFLPAALPLPALANCRPRVALVAATVAAEGLSGFGLLRRPLLLWLGFGIGEGYSACLPKPPP